MKMLVSFIAVIVAASSVAAAARAGEPSDRPGRNFDPERRARMLEEFDADDDGKLSEDERATARETMRERRGKGGKAKGERGARGPKGDRQGRRGTGRGPDGGRRGGPPHIDPDEIFSKFDEDNNDSLSREEFRHLANHVQKKRRDMMERFRDRGRDGPGYDRGPDGPPPLGQRFGPPRPGWDEGSGRRGRRDFHRRDFRRHHHRRGRPDNDFGPPQRSERPAEIEPMDEPDEDKTSV